MINFIKSIFKKENLKISDFQYQVLKNWKLSNFTIKDYSIVFEPFNGGLNNICFLYYQYNLITTIFENPLIIDIETKKDKLLTNKLFELLNLNLDRIQPKIGYELYYKENDFFILPSNIRNDYPIAYIQIPNSLEYKNIFLTQRNNIKIGHKELLNRYNKTNYNNSNNFIHWWFLLRNEKYNSIYKDFYMESLSRYKFVTSSIIEHENYITYYIESENLYLIIFKKQNL